MQIEVNPTGGYQTATQLFSSFSTGTWYFIYGFADGSNAGISINNAAATTVAYTGSLRDGTTALRVGSTNGSSNFMDGRIDIFCFGKAGS